MAVRRTRKTITMRALVKISVSLCALLWPSLGHAQGSQDAVGPYPTRPVRIVVPFAAGGPGDLISRLIAQKLSEGLGKQFYVENQGGAGGNIGMGVVARARPPAATRSWSRARPS